MFDVTRLARTVAIVPTYQNATIGDFVLRLICLGIGHVVLVVPQQEDAGIIRLAMNNLMKTHPVAHRVSLVEKEFPRGGQAKSDMLNAGLDFVEDKLNQDIIDYVLMVSSAVLLEASHLERLMDDMKLPSNMVARLKIRGIGRTGEPVSLGTAYRHMLALYRRTVFSLDPRLHRFEDSDDDGDAWKHVLKTVTNYRAEESANLPESLWVSLDQHRTPDEEIADER